ncbi:hypothetical protein EDB87DRAFT_1181668 [Lactarius vividus]|nr:hypothetical protein EDB87DRAFT_1181668 [Lactarius vividus]
MLRAHAKKGGEKNNGGMEGMTDLPCLPFSPPDSDSQRTHVSRSAHAFLLPSAACVRNNNLSYTRSSASRTLLDERLSEAAHDYLPASIASACIHTVKTRWRPHPDNHWGHDLSCFPTLSRRRKLPQPVRPLFPVLRRTGSALESQQGTVVGYEQAVKYRSGRARPLMIGSGGDERQDAQGKKGAFDGRLLDRSRIAVALSELSSPEMGMLIRGCVRI